MVDKHRSIMNQWSILVSASVYTLADHFGVSYQEMSDSVAKYASDKKISLRKAIEVFDSARSLGGPFPGGE